MQVLKPNLSFFHSVQLQVSLLSYLRNVVQRTTVSPSPGNRIQEVLLTPSPWSWTMEMQEILGYVTASTL